MNSLFPISIVSMTIHVKTFCVVVCFKGAAVIALVFAVGVVILGSVVVIVVIVDI